MITFSMCSRPILAPFGLVALVLALASCVQGGRASSGTHRLAATVERREPKLERAGDREAMREIFLRHFRGIDRHNARLIDSAFWAEGQVNYASKPLALPGDAYARDGATLWIEVRIDAGGSTIRLGFD